MLALLADENFNHYIVRGVRLQNPEVDIVRVQDVGLSGADDPTILAWAAAEDRLLLTHDVTTMTRYAIDRVREGQRMPGVVVVNHAESFAEAIADIILLVACSMENEWDGQVVYLPLQ